jgi:hypothetical protein
VDSSFSPGGVVLFELPTKAAGERLLHHLGTNRWAWLKPGDEASILCALLYPDPGDLAVLLRAVQAWVERSWLAAIRFEVDGRTYVLEGAQRLLAAS